MTIFSVSFNIDSYIFLDSFIIVQSEAAENELLLLRSESEPSIETNLSQFDTQIVTKLFDTETTIENISDNINDSYDQALYTEAFLLDDHPTLTSELSNKSLNHSFFQSTNSNMNETIIENIEDTMKVYTMKYITNSEQQTIRQIEQVPSLLWTSEKQKIIIDYNQSNSNTTSKITK